MLKGLLLSIFASVQAVYLSTLVGPLQTMPGPPSYSLSILRTFDTDTGLFATSTGYIGSAGSGSSCLVSNIGAEQPLAGSLQSPSIFTLCSATQDATSVKLLAYGSVVGTRTYTSLGSTSVFDTSVVQRLTTDNGNNFYILTRFPSGNTTVWWLTKGGDLTVIQDTFQDGWIIQHIQISQGALMAIGNTILTPFARNLLWWGNTLPTRLQIPVPYPGLLVSNGNGFVGFVFSDATTLWLLTNSAGSTGSSSMLTSYIYNRQSLVWAISGYYMFNTTQPSPNTLVMLGSPLLTKFYGITPNSLMEYSIGIPSGGAIRNTILTGRILMTADRNTGFRGLTVSTWTQPTQTQTMTRTATATASPTSSSSASSSASATQSTIPSVSSSVSATTTGTHSSVVSSTTFPTFSAVYSPTSAPSVSYEGSLTPTSLGVTQSVSPIPTISPSPTSTFSLTNSSNAAAVSTGPDIEDLKLGFGIAVPLLVLGASFIGIFMLFKSGKLFTMFKSKPNYFKHGYGKQTSARAPRIPMENHPAFRANPLAPMSTQMTHNLKVLDQMRAQKKAYVKQETEETTVTIENGVRTIIKTRVSFAPSLSTTRLPISKTVTGTSV
jgi:hypothetical protein